MLPAPKRFGSPQSDATVDAPPNHATTNKLTAKQVDAEQVDAGLLRLAGGADCAQLAGLALAFRDFLGRSEPDAESSAGSGARLLGDPGTDFVIAYAGDRAIGYCQLRYRFSLWCDGIEAHVDDFFVADEARGRDARVVGLTTNERNADALRLYQRAGFAADRARWDGRRQLWLELEPKQVDGK